MSDLQDHERVKSVLATKIIVICYSGHRTLKISADMTDYVGLFLNVKPTLYSQDNPHWVIIQNLFDILSDSSCYNFV